jgi:uncharacterized protein (DUF1778 family)
MNSVLRNKPKARLDFRLNTESKEIIEQAASASGQTVSEFAVSTLVRSAQEILDREQTLRFSNRDFDALLEAIDAGREPNDALKLAAERYKQRYAH